MTAPQSWSEWQAFRKQLISGPHGYTALREIVTLSGEAYLAETSARLIPTEKGLLLHAVEADQITLDGKPFAGERILRSLDEPDPNVIGHPGGVVKIETEFDRYDVQYFDEATLEAAPAHSAELYPYNEDFIFEGTFHKAPVNERQVIHLLRGGELVSRASGHIDVRIGEHDYSLFVIERSSYLLIGFSDGTTIAGETPRPGRFLRLPQTEDGESVRLDFNFSVIMPCAFTSLYNCPLPPATNVIEHSIAAGEKRPLRRN